MVELKLFRLLIRLTFSFKIEKFCENSKKLDLTEDFVPFFRTLENALIEKEFLNLFTLTDCVLISL